MYYVIRLQGSVLVSVTSADQEAFVETLMTPYANFDFWLGYSDTVIGVAATALSACFKFKTGWTFYNKITSILQCICY